MIVVVSLRVGTGARYVAFSGMSVEGEMVASGVLALFELALQSLEAEVDGFLE